MKLGRYTQAAIERNVHPLAESQMRSVVRALVRDGDFEEARDVCDLMSLNPWLPEGRFMFWMGFWDAMAELHWHRRDQGHKRTMKRIERDERRLARATKPDARPVSNSLNGGGS